MQGEALERWRELCEQAVVEEDSDRLHKLIDEINALLDEKEQQLRRQRAKYSGFFLTKSG
jgi:hypothetical protein